MEALLGEKQPEKKKKKKVVEKSETSGMSVDVGKTHKENKQKKLNEEVIVYFYLWPSKHPE